MDTLVTCIQNEAVAMTALVTVLTQEQSALIQAPTLALLEEINQITEEKNQLILSLIQLSQLRLQALTRLGFDPEETLLPKWLQEEAHMQLWSQLITETTRAKELNYTNGLLLAKHLARNQSLLDVLHQNHDAQAELTLYGADGQSNTPRNNHRGVLA